MSESTKVFYLGSTATFHPNKGSATRGFIYSAGRRVYGTITQDGVTTAFAPNAHAVEAQAAASV